LRSRQTTIKENLERQQKRKDNPIEARPKSTVEVPSSHKKPSILDRLGPKELKDHQKVDSWTSDRFLKIKETTPDQKTRNQRFLNNFITTTLSTHQQEISRDAEKLQKQRALEKDLEYKYSEEYRLEKESNEIVTSLENNEMDLVNVNNKIEQLKEDLKNQKRLEHESILSNFCKTKTKPSVYYRPAKIDDWVTKKFGIKVIETVEEDDDSHVTESKKVTREEKHVRENEIEEENERAVKKRRVEEEKKEERIDDEIQIIEVRSARKDNDMEFSIKLGEGGRTFVK